MSKKDYVAIAAIIRNATDVQDIRLNIAAYFASQNKAFDPQRFLVASKAP